MVGGVDHHIVVDVKVERVVGLAGVMGVAALGFVPGDDLAGVLNDGLARGNVLHCKHPFAMHAGAARLNALAKRWRAGCAGH